MKVEMKSTQSACPEGHTVVRYEKGAVVDLPDSLARVFIDQGWAKKSTVRKTKNREAAPENKSATGGRRRDGA